MTRRWLLCLALLPAAAPAALFRAAQQELLGAQAAGSAGALALSRPSVDGLLYNPAALPQDEPLHWAFFGGQGGSGRSLGSAGLSAAWDEGLRLGLLADEHVDPLDSGLQERSYGAVLSLGPPQRWSLGLRARAQQLQADGLDAAAWGGGLDLGFLSAAQDLGPLPGRWSLGAAVDQAVSAWDAAGYAQALPPSLRLGLAWQPAGGWTLGAEGDWGQADGPHWRGGAEWSLPAGLALRAGWRDEAGGQWTAGAGAALPWGGLALDYAYLSDAAGGAGAHRFSLGGRWDFPRPYRVRLVTEQLLSDPDSGRFLQASFRADLDPRLQGRAWSLELRDAGGKLLRVLEPLRRGAGVSWDGLDSHQAVVALKGGLIARLRVRLDHASLEETVELMAAGASEPTAEAEPAPELPGGTQLPAPTLKPVFADDAGKQLSHVLLQIPATASVPAKAWRLDIQDNSRRSLRVLKGDGALPQQLVWDGKDEQGRQVQDPLGVRMKLEVQDRKGRTLTRELPLFTQKAFEIARREARQRPELRLASLGLPLFLGRPALRWGESQIPSLLRRIEQSQADLARELRRRQRAEEERLYRRQEGQAWLLDLFANGRAEVLSKRERLIPGALAQLQPGPTRALQVEGLASAQEPQGLALARRRAWRAGLSLWKHSQPDQALALAPAQTDTERKGVRLSALELPAETAESSEALALAPAALISAHYGDQDLDAQPSAAASALARPLSAVLRDWDLGLAPQVAQAWSPVTHKLAFFHHNWVWITDEEGRSLRSLWYEPDLRAAGQLRFSEDGTHLWLRADAWRRWLDLALSAPAKP